ncbi:MAG TPA: ribosomal protein S18-alanine N-acetyltransferase [Asticcacaulis sp.]|nr:ribosomal protein S18-alanine N-acetyltransferase [Asticcacaulis sp.]
MIRLSDSHAGDMARIHAQCFDHPWSAGVMADLTMKASHRAHGLEQDGVLTSFILLTVVADEGEILTFATDPAVQGRGLATDLLAAVMTNLREDGVSQISLEVAVDNAAALRLYEKAGFVSVGLRKAYYSRPGKAPVDGRILRLALI